MDATRKRQLAMYRYLAEKKKSEATPEPAPEPVVAWVRTPEWDAKYHIPSDCPRCGKLVLDDSQAPFEIFCLSCGTQIVPGVPAPEGWTPPPMFTGSLVQAGRQWVNPH